MQLIYQIYTGNVLCKNIGVACETGCMSSKFALL